MSAAVLAPSWTGTRWGHAVLESELLKCSKYGKGSRHKAFCGTTIRVLQVVAGKELDEDYALARLATLGYSMKPTEKSEIHRILRYGQMKGRQHPRTAGAASSPTWDPREARLKIWAVAHAAMGQQHRWAHPATAGTDLRVLIAVCLTAMRASKIVVGISVRQVAEAAGVGVATAYDALGRLEGTWIRRTHCADQRRSKDRSSYRIMHQKSYTDDLMAEGGATTEQWPKALQYGSRRRCSLDAQGWKPTVSPVEHFGGGVAAPGFELWRRRSNAWRLYVALEASEERVSAAELAKGLDMRVRTVHNNLGWLADAGMVEHDNGRWWALRPAAEQVEADLELIPGEVRRRRHRLDRTAHKLRLEKSRTRGAFGAGAISEEAFELRMEGMELFARRVHAAVVVLQADWKAAREAARDNAVARRGRWRLV